MEFNAVIEKGQNIDNLVEDYKKMGVKIDRILKLTGIICGTSDNHTLEELKIAGIKSVEEDDIISISIHPRERHFTKIDLKDISVALKNMAKEFPYKGDISDMGNQLGIAIGTLYENLNEEEISDIISGLEHGISLTNGTHG